MTRLAALFLGLCLSTQASWAETVRVRSGEHADFSRLVFIFNRAIGFDVSQTDTGPRVTFDRDGLEPDLSTVFDFIPRDRITDVTLSDDGGAIDIATACACPVDTFLVDTGIIAVDIYDIGADLPPRDAVEPEQEPQTATSPAVDLPLVVPTPSLATPFPSSPVPTPGPEEVAAEIALPPPAPDAPMNSAGIEAFEAADLAARLRERLSSELARAAASGLIEVEGVADGDGSVLPIEQGEDPQWLDEVRRQQSRVTLPFGQEERPEDAFVAARCRSAEAALSGFPTSDDPYGDISRARAALLDGSGRPAEDAAVDLARVYVGYGFGTEALRVLDQIGRAPAPAQFDAISLLRAAAALLDGAESGGTDLSVLADCGNQASLWGLAAANGRSVPDVPEEQNVLASFDAMPDEMSLVLGEAMIETLFASGEDGIGYALRRALDLKREAAGLATLWAMDDPDTTGPDVVALGSEFEDQRSHLARMRADLAASTPIPEDGIDLALAYAEELRGTDLSADLFDAAAQAHMALGRPEAAFNVMDRLATFEAGSRQAARYAALVAQAINLEQDSHFLGAVFGRDLLDEVEGLPSDTVEGMAERLAALGFERQAEMARRALVTAPTNETAARLETVAQPSADELAEATPASAPDPEGEAATAPEATPAPSASTLAPPPGLGEEDGTRLARLETLRARIAALQDPTQGPQPAAVSEGPEDGALARGRALLDASQESRALLEALLQPADSP